MSVSSASAEGSVATPVVLGALSMAFFAVVFVETYRRLAAVSGAVAVPALFPAGLAALVLLASGVLFTRAQRVTVLIGFLAAGWEVALMLRLVGHALFRETALLALGALGAHLILFGVALVLLFMRAPSGRAVFHFSTGVVLVLLGAFFRP